MTKQEVFQKLLELYRQESLNQMEEQGISQSWDRLVSKLDQEIEEWQKQYTEAQP